MIAPMKFGEELQCGAHPATVAGQLALLTDDELIRSGRLSWAEAEAD